MRTGGVGPPHRRVEKARGSSREARGRGHGRYQCAAGFSPPQNSWHRQAGGRIGPSALPEGRGTTGICRSEGSGRGQDAGRRSAVDRRSRQTSPGRCRPTTSITISATAPAASSISVSRERRRTDLISANIGWLLSGVYVAALFSFFGAPVKNFLRTLTEHPGTRERRDRGDAPNHRNRQRNLPCQPPLHKSAESSRPWEAPSPRQSASVAPVFRCGGHPLRDAPGGDAAASRSTPPPARTLVVLGRAHGLAGGWRADMVCASASFARWCSRR